MMNAHLILFFLGSGVIIGGADAAVARCDGPCALEQQETCEAMLARYEFGGECCSLQDNPVTGNCIIQISNGSCYWNDPCDMGCTPECPQEGESVSCLVPYTQWFATSMEACPPSSYDALGRTTQPCCPEAPCPIFASSGGNSPYCDITREYMGCYNDNGGRVMDIQLEDDLSMNECIQQCADLEYPFAGLQAGRHCFCGLDNYDSLGPSPNCDTRCRNGPGICGGNWANAVYSTGVSTEVTRDDYVGCFRDAWRRVMGHRLMPDGLSIDECIEGCSSLLYAYAGLQAGRQCFCGNVYDARGTADNCDTPCRTGSGFCGGNWANSVYETL